MTTPLAPPIDTEPASRPAARSSNGLGNGLHYRRSLASRVTLLSTLAGGFAVSAVAFAAYATVRAQAVGALDESLRSRAEQAASVNSLNALAQERVPAWALGAASVNIVFVNVVTDPTTIIPFSTTGDSLAVSQRELDVAAGKAESSARTVWSHGVRWRMVAVSAGDNQALVLAQSM